MRSSVPTDSFEVVVLPAAVAEFRAIPFPFRRQLNQKIFKLKLIPRPGEAVLVENEVFVLPLDRWGLIYEVDDDSKVITVFGVMVFSR